MAPTSSTSKVGGGVPSSESSSSHGGRRRSPTTSTLRNLAFVIFLGFASTLTGLVIITQSNAIYTSHMNGEEFDTAITMPTTIKKKTEEAVEGGATPLIETTTIAARKAQENEEDSFNTETSTTQVTAIEVTVGATNELPPSATNPKLPEVDTTVTPETTTSRTESSSQAIAPIDQQSTINTTAQAEQTMSQIVSSSSSSSIIKPPESLTSQTTTLTSNVITNATATTAQEFVKQDGVVIATKIHSTNHLIALKQMLCLLHYAYNNRVLYDIVVFSTYPINDPLLEPIRNVVAPANLTLIVDTPPLKDVINSLQPPYRKEHLLKRCNKTIEEIHWYDFCEENGKYERLAYTWQAEFRSLQIWTHPILQQYKYMMWLDTDAFCTTIWDNDPISYMINNDLVLLFDNFPQGTSHGAHMQERFVRAFNTTLCSIELHDGKLYPELGHDCPDPVIPLGKFLRLLHENSVVHQPALFLFPNDLVFFGYVDFSDTPPLQNSSWIHAYY